MLSAASVLELSKPLVQDALICLHECRHTYAALMIAAGVNAKSLSSYMGHSTITMTPNTHRIRLRVHALDQLTVSNS